MEELENKYRMYISAYLGIELLDEYPLKPYILEELKEYIMEFAKSNDLTFDFKEEYAIIAKHNTRLVYLQDALYTMNELNAPIDLIHLIENRIKSIKENI